MDLKYFIEETKIVKKTIKLWWANYYVHYKKDHINLDLTFNKIISQLSPFINKWHYATILRNGLNQLCDGHLYLKPSPEEGARYFQSGLEFKVFREGIYLVNIKKELYLNLKNAPEVGDCLGKIEDLDITSYFKSFILKGGSTPGHRFNNFLHALSWQERFPEENIQPLKLKLRKISGFAYNLKINWIEQNKIYFNKHSLPTIKLSPNLLYINVKSFCFKDELGNINDMEFLNEIQNVKKNASDCKEIIIDLRENSGGSNKQAQTLANLITKDPLVWLCYREKMYSNSYSGSEIRIINLNPSDYIKAANFEIIWFIIGPTTYSTCEVLLHAVKKVPNVRLVGQPTGGGAGNPTLFRLPFTGLNLYIPINKIYIPANKSRLIETNPIIPQYPVVPGIIDFLNGRDTVINYIMDQLR